MAPPTRTPCARDADCPAQHFCAAEARVCLPAVVEVAAGAHHTCARHGDGTVTCWGLAESIRAGGAAVLPPVEIATVRGARALAAGVHQSCAISRTGGVRCWGNQGATIAGEDGVPLEGVEHLALGEGYGCAANGAGVHCWGRNDFGQLGRPLTTKESSAALLAHPGPVLFLGAGIAALTVDPLQRVCAWGRNATKMITASDDVGVYTSPQCAPVEPALSALAVGDTHACLRHLDGRFRCWGERYYGQLGIGGADTADLAPPGTPTSIPGTAATVTALAAGVSHTCALLSDGAVFCFGRNHLGQIGPNVTSPEEEIRTPTLVGGLPGKAIALGGGSRAQHTCAILQDGRVACWGHNHAGQLGAGATTVDDTRTSRTPLLVAF